MASGGGEGREDDDVIIIISDENIIISSGDDEGREIQQLLFNPTRSQHVESNASASRFVFWPHCELWRIMTTTLEVKQSARSTGPS